MNAERARRLGAMALGVLASAGLAAGVALNTEWVEHEEPRAPRGPAAYDAWYALERILAELSVTVVRKDALEDLPPNGARLLLTTWVWGVLPERDRALRSWVEGGGHLVIPSNQITDRDGKVIGWIPVMPPKPKPRGSTPTAPPVPGATTGVPATKPGAVQDCVSVREPDEVVSAYAEGRDGDGQARTFSMCAASHFGLYRPRESALWALQYDDNAPTLLRVAVGRGSVTLIPYFYLFGPPFTENRNILRADNAAIAVAMLQAAPGATVWIIDNERSGDLPAWLWNHAALAVLLALLAVLLWLWRGADRFGPPTAAAAPARRSMAAQIRGTASFLWQRSPASLHAAQLRALDETAQRKLRGYARLDRADRNAALAAATGIGAATIARAVNFGAAATVQGLPQALATLESARRILAHQRPQAAPPATPARTPATLPSKETAP